MITEQILSTCKQLNRLLKAKDPYHADLVATLLSKVEDGMNGTTQKQGVDKHVIMEALKNID